MRNSMILRSMDRNNFQGESSHMTSIWFSHIFHKEDRFLQAGNWVLSSTAIHPVKEACPVTQALGAPNEWLTGNGPPPPTESHRRLHLGVISGQKCDKKLGLKPVGTVSKMYANILPNTDLKGEEKGIECLNSPKIQHIVYMERRKKEKNETERGFVKSSERSTTFNSGSFYFYFLK